MAETQDKPKTNRYCPFYADGRCDKIKKQCNNKFNFYEECNTYIGNKSLKMFF